MKFFKGKNRTQLKKSYSPEGIRFSFKGDAPPVFPLNKNAPEILSKLLPEGDLWATLDNLWSEDLVTSEKPGTWLIPWDIYERFDNEEDREVFDLLRVPSPKVLPLETSTSSHVGDPAFRVKVEARHPEHGPLRDGDYPRFGSVFFLGADDIVPLTSAQQSLFDIAEGIDVQWDNLEDRMAYLAMTRGAAQSAGATLDGYLKNEEYEFASGASIDFREDSPDEITLIPHIEGMEAYGVENGEDLLKGAPRPVLTKADSTLKRKRLVLDKDLRQRIDQLPKNGKVTGADVPRLVTNPEQILPDGFELALFSERVKGIRTKVYNSRPYIHVKRSTGGWFEGIPGIALDDWSPGETTDGEKSDAESGQDGPSEISPDTYRELQRRAQENGDEFVKHGDAWVRIDPEQGDRLDQVLEKYEKQVDGSFKIPAGSVLEIYENLELLEFMDPTSATFDDVQLPDDLPEIDIPESFNGELFPFQLSGYRWLSRLSKHRIGGLLADEMGLGKTVQTIAHLLRLKEVDGAGPHLIVMPKSLLENWRREINEFSQGKLSACIHGGGQRLVNPEYFKNFDVVLTTYDTLRREQAKLGTIDWNMVVCDEAQYAKNPTAQRTSAVKAMKSRHRVALTGTPVENGLIEFWCIMDFVQPGLLGSWSDFRKKYERPIVEGEESEREKTISNLLAEIKGFYLRRLKSDTLKDLPSKTFEFHVAPLSDHQFYIYQEIAREGKAGGKGAALGAIQRLLMLSAHPLAVQGAHIDGKDAGKLTCPKLDETLKVLSHIKDAEEKAIIFTDFKVVQRILQDAIRSKFDLWADIINGEVTGNRQTIIDIFSEKEGFNILILGHQVGGVGLNITAANHVIHYTRPWNPAKENQATDRVHRIGQTKPITVYYPIVKDERFVTVEERLDELIRSKADLARDVLRPSAEMKLKPEDLLDCLDIEEKAGNVRGK